MPGSRACVPVRALLSRFGRAGLPGAFWCASLFLWPFCHSSLFGPLRAWVVCFFFCLFLPLSTLLPCRAPAVSGFLWFRALDALGLGAVHLLLPPSCIFFAFLFLVLSSHLPFRAAAVSGFLCFPALGALGLGALRLLLPPLPPALFFLLFFFALAPSSCFPPPLSRPPISGFLCFPALGALGLGALCLLLPPPPAPALFFLPPPEAVPRTP